MRFGQSCGNCSEMTSAADQALKKPLNSRSESGNYRDCGCALIAVSGKNDFRSISVSLNSRTTFASAGKPCPDRYPVSSVQLTRGVTSNVKAPYFICNDCHNITICSLQ